MTMNKKYTPSKGDLIWLDFKPQAARETEGLASKLKNNKNPSQIMKRRPALVLSPQEYNKHGALLAVPIASKTKGYPFEVKINNDKMEFWTGERTAFIFWLINIQTHYKLQVLLLDEFDSGISDDAIPKFYELLTNFSKKYGVQIFITTHRKNSLNTFTEETKGAVGVNTFGLDQNQPKYKIWNINDKDGIIKETEESKKHGSQCRN